MQPSPDEAAAAVERNPCPKCEVPAGSVCRTRAGKVAAKYHTARFILVPTLREDLAVTVPPAAAPARPGVPGPRSRTTPPGSPATPIRIGYARCSTTGQDLDVQLATLHKANCRTVFSEKISSRVKQRPEFEKALALARQIKQPGSLNAKERSSCSGEEPYPPGWSCPRDADTLIPDGGLGGGCPGVSQVEVSGAVPS